MPEGGIIMLVNGKVINLAPTDSHKSFYGKAKVIIAENGEKTLISYSTRVAKIDSDGNFERLWGGYSATTMRHINSFRETYGLDSIGKKQWEEL